VFGHSYFVAFAVAADFGAVAAVAHVAPAATVVFATIDKEPAAIIAFALVHFRNQICANEKVCG
jgi:hypothetical protein